MRKAVIFMLILSALPALAQHRSAKRGTGWDEKTQPISGQTLGKMAPGVAWIYNWGVAPKGESSFSQVQPAMDFAPMCWNANYDEAALRAYLTAHPSTKYLLGFNEPNFASQSNMSPEAAVRAWPRLERLAEEYGLRLVAPALNFTAERVGGRIWSPYEWLDEFFRLYPAARVDLLAMHCYMNWHSSCTWLATEYFYNDLYDASKTDAYGRYPHLVAALDAYKAREGHFPRMMLTEFCAWENDGTITGADFQIDQMTQKVQALEQSDLVEGYAWFMANATRATDYPYMSLLETNTSSSQLSTLGTVYVNMSSFDTSYYYSVGEPILAKDYVDASVDRLQVRLRPNTQPDGDSPLQVELQAGSWVVYQVSVAADGDYTLQLMMRSEAETSLYYDLDQNRRWAKIDLPSTADEWQWQSQVVSLKAGRHQLRLWNSGTASLLLSQLALEVPTGISQVEGRRHEAEGPVYNLKGQRQCSLSRGLNIADHRLLFVK